MKTVILIAAFALLFIISSMDAKRLSDDSDRDDGLDLSDKKARMLLRSMMNNNDDEDEESPSMDARQAGRGCVLCKFGLSPCCAPNFCQKKFLRPDTCIRVNPGK